MTQYSVMVANIEFAEVCKSAVANKKAQRISSPSHLSEMMRNLGASMLSDEAVVQFWSIRRGGFKCGLWFALVSGLHKYNTAEEEESVKADPIL